MRLEDAGEYIHRLDQYRRPLRYGIEVRIVVIQRKVGHRGAQWLQEDFRPPWDIFIFQSLDEPDILNGLADTGSMPRARRSFT